MNENDSESLLSFSKRNEAAIRSTETDSGLYMNTLFMNLQRSAMLCCLPQNNTVA
jgi:hypothetical protein